MSWPTETWPHENWLDIGALDDIPRQGARVVKTPQGCVAVFRTVQDQVFAMDDRCPHKDGPLSEGIVHGTSVTCPLHAWVFSLETGRAQGADDGAVATYAVRVEAGRLLLDARHLAGRVAA
jgi:nitrite reductase (NADH) small subunit